MNTRALILPFLFLGPLALAACGPTQPWVPSLRDELTRHDYAVYSAWLISQTPRNGRLVLVDAQTTSTGHLGLALTGAMTSDQVAYPTAGPATGSPPLTLTPARAEALQDFTVQQELSLRLERRLAGAEYELVSDPIPSHLQSRAQAAVVFSRVGFDREAQVATLRVTQAMPGEWGWSGQGVHYEVWAERRSGPWELVYVREFRRSNVPVSDGVVPPADPPPPARPAPPLCRSPRKGIRFCVYGEGSVRLP